MRTGIHFVGGVARLTAQFTDPFDGHAPIDPDAVHVAWASPEHAGAAGEWEETREYEEEPSGDPPYIVRDAEGEYHLDLDLADTPAGRWEFSWWSTGDGQAAATGSFSTSAILVAPPEE